MYYLITMLFLVYLYVVGRIVAFVFLLKRILVSIHKYCSRKYKMKVFQLTTLSMIWALFSEMLASYRI